MDNPVRIELRPGQAIDASYAGVLLADYGAFGVLADNAYDAD